MRKQSKIPRLQYKSTPDVDYGKVAIVYDRVNKWGGAERVLLALHEIFPKALLYTSVYDEKKAAWAKVFPEIKTSFLQKIPFARSNHEFLAPLMPLAFESFDFSGFDLVISVTSEAAKGIKTDFKTLHICYCLTPTRYLWSGYGQYFKGGTFKAMTKLVVDYLKNIDRKIAKRPDVMIAISSEVKNRIKKYYQREAEIIFPPVEIYKNPEVEVQINPRRVQSYYLLVSRLDFGYKKVELAIEAFNKLGKNLIIVGTGREEKKLKKMAKENIEFMGWVSEKKLANYYKNAKALITPQEEDFGIVAVEAQSYGVPVIAFKKGGAIDTVIPGKTGLFFNKQKSESLIDAVKKFEKMKFSKKLMLSNAQKFSAGRFKKELLALISRYLIEYNTV